MKTHIQHLKVYLCIRLLEWGYVHITYTLCFNCDFERDYWDNWGEKMDGCSPYIHLWVLFLVLWAGVVIFYSLWFDWMTYECYSLYATYCHLLYLRGMFVTGNLFVFLSFFRKIKNTGHLRENIPGKTGGLTGLDRVRLDVVFFFLKKKRGKKGTQCPMSRQKMC